MVQDRTFEVKPWIRDWRRAIGSLCYFATFLLIKREDPEPHIPPYGVNGRQDSRGSTAASFSRVPSSGDSRRASQVRLEV